MVRRPGAAAGDRSFGPVDHHDPVANDDNVASEDRPPIITVARQSRVTWRLGPGRATFASGKRHKPPVGTVFSFTLNEKASVNFTFAEQLSGRNAKGRCVPQTTKSRKGHQCKRRLAAGTLSFTGHAGANKVSFQGTYLRFAQAPARELHTRDRRERVRQALHARDTALHPRQELDLRPLVIVAAPCTRATRSSPGSATTGEQVASSLVRAQRKLRAGDPPGGPASV
jgi:hypothetical protein